jgi:hypothetical protein
VKHEIDCGLKKKIAIKSFCLAFNKRIKKKQPQCLIFLLQKMAQGSCLLLNVYFIGRVNCNFIQGLVCSGCKWICIHIINYTQFCLFGKLFKYWFFFLSHWFFYILYNVQVTVTLRQTRLTLKKKPIKINGFPKIGKKIET